MTVLPEGGATSAVAAVLAAHFRDAMLHDQPLPADEAAGWAARAAVATAYPIIEAQVLGRAEAERLDQIEAVVRSAFIDHAGTLGADPSKAGTFARLVHRRLRSLS